jgi:hypothetical protein
MLMASDKVLSHTISVLVHNHLDVLRNDPTNESSLNAVITYFRSAVDIGLFDFKRLMSVLEDAQ